MSKQYFIGLMSGTSLDGVDAALVKINPAKKKTQLNIQLKGFLTLPMPADLQADLQQLNLTPQIHLAKLAQLQVQVAKVFIEATQALLAQTQLSASDIQAIGSHGQTIFHDPKIPMSLQIGHPAFIAKQTGIKTVGDFRVDDMALGGQGAPIAPAFHQALFQSEQPVALANIGGIANISLIPAFTQKMPLLGFDTGPGNGLMDEWCQQYFNCHYDQNGQLAAQGKIHQPLLNRLLKEDYFKQTAPKSTGRDYFNQAWLKLKLKGFEDLNPLAVLATLNALTAQTLAQAVLAHSSKEQSFKQLTLCGGGAYNTTLLNNLGQALPNLTIQTTQALDINPHAIEAMMCAWLAHQRIEQHPIALKAVTGASQNAILGGIWSF